MAYVSIGASMVSFRLQQAANIIGSGNFWWLMSSLNKSLWLWPGKITWGPAWQCCSLHASESLALYSTIYFGLLPPFEPTCYRSLPVWMRVAFIRSSSTLGSFISEANWVAEEWCLSDAMVLANSLGIALKDDLKVKINDKLNKLKPILTTGTWPLYFFLIEIQVMATIQMGEYLSDDQKTKCPLMWPVWQLLTEIFKPRDVMLILSETAINEWAVHNVLNLGTFKIDQYSLHNDISAFDNPASQGQYINWYLPMAKRLPQTGESAAAWQEFLKQAWGWCHGRYDSCYQIDSYLPLCS